MIICRINVPVQGMKIKRKSAFPLRIFFLILIWALPTLCIYLLVPHAVKTFSYAGTRFAIFIPLFFIVMVSAIRLKGFERYITAFLVLIITMLILKNVFTEFSRFNQATKALFQVINQLPKNEVLLELYYPEKLQQSVNHPWAFVHLSCYYAVWRDGIPAFIFSDCDPWHILEKRKEVRKWGDNLWFDSWQPYRMVIPNGIENYNHFLIFGNIPF